MKKYICFCSICLLLFFSACQEKNTIHQFEWLLGSWENELPDGRFAEVWKKESDTSFTGGSFYMNTHDTLFAESIKLVKRKKDFYYIVTVTYENEAFPANENPIAFKLTNASSDYLVFENPKHDFPKKITYKLVNKDSIYAEISGNGKSQEFPFKRLN